MLEPDGDLSAGARVGLGELSGERAERAAARATGCIGLGDDGVAPGTQAAGGAEVGLPLVATMVRAWWSMTACTRSSLSGK